MIAGPIASQLGPWSLAANDARFKLDRIHQSELVERQGAPGPMCFGPRIMGQPRHQKPKDPVEPPESMWTSGAELSCSGGGSSFAGEMVLSGAGEDVGAGEVV
jgi:hypothetical protein